MKCETCESHHNGSFGSGRFCSVQCARSFATRKTRTLISKKVSDTFAAQNPHRKYNWAEIQAFYDEGHLLKECFEKYGFCKVTLGRAKKRGEFKTRPSKIALVEMLKRESKIPKLRYKILKEGALEEICVHCGISEWMGQKLSLHLDHIDGNPRNNQLSNLRFLCPNCHSQTSTYCGRNIRKRRQGKT